MRRTLAVFVLLFALSSIVFAHGNQKHVMGTVTNIFENSLSVETTSKKTVSVNIGAWHSFKMTSPDCSRSGRGHRRILSAAASSFISNRILRFSTGIRAPLIGWHY